MEKLDKKEIEDIFSLTSMQEGMLFHYLKDPGNDAYIEQLSLRINGEIDIQRFNRAWNRVISINEMLRTVFRWEMLEHPIQVVLKKHQFQLEFYDFTGKKLTGAFNTPEEIKSKDRINKFDLRKIPLRVILCKIQETTYEMIISYHHILYDGWSNGIILREFFEAYDVLHRFGQDHPGQLYQPGERSKTKFKEFIKLSRNRVLEKEEKFWRSYLRGVDSQAQPGLPVKCKKRLEKAATGKYQFKYTTGEKDRIEDFIKKHKFTLASIFYSAWGLLLQKYNSSDDVIFGTTVSGRTARIQGIENIVGLFINTLPLRIQTSPGEQIEKHLYRMDNNLQERVEYENSSLVDIKKYSDMESNKDLFDSIVVLENYPLKLSIKNSNMQEKDRSSMYVESYSLVEGTHYDLTIVITVFSGFEVSFFYNESVFSHYIIENMCCHFKKLTLNIASSSSDKISDIEIITKEEKIKILYDFNNTGADYPGDKTIHQCFQEQVEHNPGYVAVKGIQETRGQAPISPISIALSPAYITYKELDEKSNRLAYILKEKGVKPDTLVVIMAERSLEMIIGIFAILKAGGAYLPIDTVCPPQRINYMLTDSASKIVLTTNDYSKKIKTETDIINISKAINCTPQPAPFPIYLPPTPASSPAYVIYTSGSTGKPKGVMIEHSPVVNRLNWMQAAYPLSIEDVIMQKTPVVFDVSVWELFWWSFWGSSLCLLRQGEEKDPAAIVKTIDTFGITTMHFVPSMLNVFMDYCQDSRSETGKDGYQSLLKSLKKVFSSGEALETIQVERFFNLFRDRDFPGLFNLYGPTEATVDVSFFNCSRQENLDKILIGKPIHNLQLYILDNELHLQPIGIMGELAISGIGLARGYLNKPELTSKKFCLRRPGALFIKTAPGPYKNFLLKNNQKFLRGSRGRFFQKEPPGRRRQKIYKTGDLARWLPDGNIEFIGRIDQQVKIRGFRIELGEIENHLYLIKEIKEAVVLVKEDQLRDKFLCAYFVSEEVLSQSVIRDNLSGSLPDHMIPSYFVQLEKFPLTPNGKLDRNALPEPQIKINKKYAAPGNEIEKKLVEIWRELLGIDLRGISRISIDDNFFELGGHSLKATILISRIHKEFSVKVPMDDLFKSPYIRSLARYILKSRESIYEDIGPVEKRDYYQQSSAQKRLFFLDHFEDIGTSYNMFAAYSLKGKPDKKKYAAVFKALVRQHETLRTSFHLLDNQPVQRIHDEVKFDIEEYKPTNLTAGKTWDAREFIRPFDISRAPLLRLGMVELPGEEYLLLFDMHHIISDGSSLAILVEDFAGLSAGESLPRIKIQYKDFARWQANLLEAGQIKVQEDYWLRLYKDAPELPRLNLPVDTHPDGQRPPVFTFAGDTYKFKLEQEEHSGFKSLGTENGVTVFMNVLIVLNILLYKYTGQEDIIIGCSMAGRPHMELQRVMGMFVNELPMRNNPVGEKSYKEFLKEVKTSCLRAFENQVMPFEELVDRLNPQRDPSRNPLFDVCLSVANFEGFEQKIKHVLIAPYHFENKTSKFDITWFVNDTGFTVDFNLEYCTTLFKKKTIRQLAVRFINIIRQINRNAEIRLREIDILFHSEKEQLLLNFNKTDVPWPDNKTLHQLFEAQVGKVPDHIVVKTFSKVSDTRSSALYRGKSDLHITYFELNRRANQLAYFLHREKGIGPEERVGILMNSSPELIAALLGTLKTGGAYVPLEPSLPEERLKTIINDAGINLVISQRNYIRRLNRLQWECNFFHTFLCLDSKDIYRECEEESNELMDEKLWAYVGETAVDEITGGGWFTGSTGEPFTREEMEEYGDNILKKLMPLLHRKMRVLEIGCASGITMYRVAPLVEFYYGTDLSAVIIEKNRERIKQEGYRNITLACVPAHRIDTLGEKDFDLVILNSVIQSFHGHNYLRQVIRKVMDLMDDRGYIFIGDIMDRDLKSDLEQEMARFKREYAGNSGDFKAKTNTKTKTKIDWSSELFISRSFLEDLTIEIPGIREVSFSKKIYTIENELTKFRYDSLLKVDKTPAAKKRVTGKHKFQLDIGVLKRYGGEDSKLKVFPVKPVNSAYIIYTSGTTGRPKGVVVEHGSLVNYVCWGKKCYIDEGASDYVFPLYTPFSFDLTVTSIFLPLVSGHCILIYEPGLDDKENRFAVLDIVDHDSIDIIKTTPSHLKLIQAGLCRWEGNRKHHRLKRFIVGGENLERVLAHEISERFFPGIEIFNEYGPTEAAVGCMIYKFNPDLDTGKSVPIGLPINNLKIQIFDNDMNPVPVNVPGEIGISGIGLARGYLNQPELTLETFCLRRPGALFKKTAPGPAFFRKNFLLNNNQKLLRGVQGGGFLEKSPPGRRRQKIYKTGDLARRIDDSNKTIVFLGRKDEQVKIRGYRIELKEIRDRLKEHEAIKEVLVTIRSRSKSDDSSNFDLCAYIVPNAISKGNKISAGMPGISELREFLSKVLPEYMVPSYFVPLEQVPLTINGKPDYKSLPAPGIHGTGAGHYPAPKSQIEKKLVDIWSEVLGIEKSNIGPDSNFFDLGGHSLKVTLQVAKIHKELEVKIPLAEVFKRQTIRQLAEFIKAAEENKYAGIEPVEKRDYYELSSAQKRMFFLHQIDVDSTGYNMPCFLWFSTGINKNKYEQEHELKLTLKKIIAGIIARHESLRTSFVRVNDRPVQRIHDSEEMEIGIEYYDMEIAGADERCEKEFVRPFDLSRAPLLRVGLTHADGKYFLIVDMHHIIADGTSGAVLIEDFLAYYSGDRDSVLRLQYKDFSHWQNHLFKGDLIKDQEDYWLDLYRDGGKIPGLFLPADFKRPEVFTFAGDHYSFIIEKEEATQFRALGNREGGTLYMNILAILNTLFFKYTGQTDIIIGSGIAGRPHVDLQGIMGMFVNTLAIRNYPQGNKTFRSFLAEVTANSISAFDNQDLQFEELVEKLDLERDPSRNPLFDICMVVQNFRKAGEGRAAVENADQAELLLPPVEPFPSDNFKNRTAKFDMTFFIHEIEGDIYVDIEYYTGIFKQETIKRLVTHFKHIIKAVIRDSSLKLKDIGIISAGEKKQILFEFNAAAQPYPKEKTIHQLFAEQVERTPDHIAVVYNEKYVTNYNLSYKELSEKSRQLARYLREGKGIQHGDRVGILLSQSLYRPIAVFGVLQSGAAYVPFDPVLPGKRIKYMIIDACIGILISEKKYVRQLNKWQWECEGFNNYLCLDTEDIRGEKESERNQLMDVELWQHVGETAVDEITGGGWVSSYTGEPFSRQEMEEYGDNALKKLTPLLHPRMRILEIGCASGITMYRLAPAVAFYYGTDLSETIIDRNNKKIREQGLRNIKLASLAAHEIHRIREKEFDLVIINSVIQCFHGHNYLGKVIKQAMDLLGQQGYIFIGDIMDLEKKNTMLRELEEFKTGHRDKSYITKTDFSSELFISRGFWLDLQAELDFIDAVEFSDKIYTIENELTGFRYDTLLTINKKSLPVKEEVKKNKRPKQKHQDDLRSLSLFKPEPIHLAQIPGEPGDPAYIIYTSGTTGNPRGVLVEHGSLVNLVYWHNRYFNTSAADRATLCAGFGFDASVWELFPYLIKGACLHVISDPVKLDAGKLKEYYNRNHITISFLPTQLCEHFLREVKDDKCSLRILLTGGDKLQTFLKRSFTLYNNYGPTENTVVTTSFHVEKPQDNIPIGKPVANNIVYIMDRGGLHLQPVGIPGELCIAGDGLARGYLNNPEYTFERFGNYKLQITNPGPPGKRKPGKKKGKRKRDYRTYIYKTSDLARWLSDGNIEFIGRIDHQVKIRGFRVELGEIQNQLLKHPEVKEAVVISNRDKQSDRYLCAYMTPVIKRIELQETGDGTLREFLSARLPEYMMPLHLVWIDRIPLTPNGKLDKNALPQPGISSHKHYVPPGNEIEKSLVQIWVDVLGAGQPEIGIDDNFFELGGHSLKATFMLAKIRSVFNIDISLGEIFKTPNIRGISSLIKTMNQKIKNKKPGPGEFFVESSPEQEHNSRIKPIEKKEYYELSSAQKRLYILHRMDKKGLEYNISFGLELQGHTDKNRLEETFGKLVQRHESLRTSFEMKGDEPVQKIHRILNFHIPHIPVFNIEHIIRDFIVPFDLSRAPLLRVGLFKVDEDSYVLIVDMHHIIADGTSLEILAKEFIKMYAEEGEDLPGLNIQYKDYTQWQNSKQRQALIKQQGDYWIKDFVDHGEIPVLNLPVDFPRPLVRGFTGEELKFEIGRKETVALKQLAHEEEVTLYMVLLSTYTIFLSKVSHQEDIIVGSPIAGRRHDQLRSIIGMFVNTLAIRNVLDQQMTFQQLLYKVKERTLAAFANQDYPFEDLVEAVVKKREAARHPVFDTLLVLQNIDIPKIRVPGLNVKPYPIETVTSKFDISLNAVESNRHLSFIVEYSTDLFRPHTIRRFTRFFKRIVTTVLENREIKLSQIEMISQEEKKKMLEDFNQICIDYSRDKTIDGLFTEQAGKTPDHVGLIGHKSQITNDKQWGMTGGDSGIFEEVQLSYKELNNRADGLAYLLREKGVASDTIVAVRLGRVVEMVIVLLGILKAGGAYMPVDPEYPFKRIKYMLEDCDAKLMVTAGTLVKEVKKLRSLEVNKNLETIFIESIEFSVFSSSHLLNFSTSHSSDLAYVIYTSGTSGRPKGCLVSHGNVISLLESKIQALDFNERDIWTMFHRYNFDFSVWEMYGALLFGGKCIIIPRELTIDLEGYLGVLKRQAVTILNQTPSAFYQISSLEMGWPDRQLKLRYVIFGGEALSPGKLKSWKEKYPFTGLINMFGITETTVHVTYKAIEKAGLESTISNIGKPLPHLSVCVLDRFMNLLPIGIAGELCVSGQGVCRGYLNNPELTAKKFNKKLLRGVQGGSFLEKSPPGCRRQNIYKSGDLVKRLDNGDMEYLGRIDHQVKIRGYRIELGEIESRILKYIKIKDVVVILKKLDNEQQYLCAYYVSQGGHHGEPLITGLREYLSESLPDYMVPSYFIRVENIPLTSNGKLDTDALPDPGNDIRESVEMPRDEIEAELQEIWSEVLGCQSKSIGIDDNFFDIGGNSLNIIKVNKRIKELFKRETAVMDMFRYTTIRSFAGYMQQQGINIKENLGRKKEKKQVSGIAVIGMAGRFPGASNIHEFWENLKNGVESTWFFSDLELESSGIDSQLLEDPDYIRANSILEGIESFDSGFFGYSPREAEVMDPQVRIFHEGAWTALEDAGYPPGVEDQVIGLYAGAMYNFDWEARVRLSGKADVLGGFASWQLMNKDFISMWVSYRLNLRGPAVFVQASCATSLVAIHLAGQAIINGECDMALAGGVSVTLFERAGYLYREGMIFSPDGHCRVFADNAAGATAGNGLGIVVLKSLDTAFRDRDHIYAVVKGSAINNDGVRKVGFTAPSIEGQAEVIRAAREIAGAAPESITYVETHGTGTSLGDPVEIEALKLAFERGQANNTNNRNKTHTIKQGYGYCAIGSVKTNVGHLDAAAGVTGFIKTVLAIHHGLLPPGLHFEHANPKIDFENSPFYVNTQLRKWKNERYPLRAGVSSFGMGGTNAHIILEEFSWGKTGDIPLPVEPDTLTKIRTKTREYQIMLLSARTATALEKQTNNLVEHLKKYPDINLADAAYTLHVGRKTFEQRRMLICSKSSEAIEWLSSPDSGKIHSLTCRKTGRPVIFMFAGQGSQYVNMGYDLYRQEVVFREEMDRCFEILKPLMGFNIKEILYPPDGFSGSDRSQMYSQSEREINRSEVALPVIFSFTYALAKLLMNWGINPQAMIGYSVGEYVPACLSGVFSLETALNLLAYRGKLLQDISGGAMLSVPLPEDQIQPLLVDGISLAVVNGPSCVVSGPYEAIYDLEQQLKEKKLLGMRLDISHAMHSRMLDPILEKYEARLRQVILNKPRNPFISNVTGKWTGSEEAKDPQYWIKQMRQPVRFADGLAELLKEKKAIFLEIGPGSDLSTLLRQQPGYDAAHRQLVLNTLRHSRQQMDDVYYLLNRIGRLWLQGIPIDRNAFYAGERRKRISLPAYPFDITTYPISGPVSTSPDFLRKKSECTPQDMHIKLPSKETKKKTDLTDWFYIPGWKISVLPFQPAAEPREKLNWLILGDDTCLTSRFEQMLREQDQKVIRVTAGTEFSKNESGEYTGYTINPGDENHFLRLWESLVSLDRVPRRIVHLWGLMELEPKWNSKKVEKNNQWYKLVRDGVFNSLLYLAKAIGMYTLDNKIQVTVVSSHMQGVYGTDLLYPEKALLLGPVLTIPREYPHITCRSIDFALNEPGSGEQRGGKTVIWLWKEVMSDSPDIITAYRGIHRFTRTYEPFPLKKSNFPVPGARLRQQGVYLVIGGLGGIGLVLAEYLAGVAQARLILTGRSPFPSRNHWDQVLELHPNKHPINSTENHDPTGLKIRKLKELEEMGARVMVCSTDVSDYQQMKRVFNAIMEQWGNINGIIHAAGIAQGGLIQQLTPRQIKDGFKAKVNGILVLDRLLKEIDKKPDFMVLCSSLNSLIGVMGEVVYGAANAFLDAYALQKTSGDGIFTQAINWDAWKGIGFAGEVKKRLVGINYPEEAAENIFKYGMSAPEGVEVFKRLLGADTPGVAVSTMDLAGRFQAAYTMEMPLGAENLKEVNYPGSQYPRPELGIPYTPPGNETEEFLCKTWEKFLGIKEVGIHDNFFELGATSLGIVRVTAIIKEALHKEIPVPTMYAYPTVKELAEYLNGETDRKKTTPGETPQLNAITAGKNKLRQRKQRLKEDGLV